jgi:hypothetical protein
MGNLTDVLHIAPQTADTAMKITLAYLLRRQIRHLVLALAAKPENATIISSIINDLGSLNGFTMIDKPPSFWR